jgi:aldehyde dehydrogenase (NAD+)
MPSGTNYIGGHWTDTTHRAVNINPSDLDDIVGEFALADAAQSDAAITAANQALPDWAALSSQRRFE